MITFKKPASIVFFVKELRKAAAWYSNILNIEPYRKDNDFIGFHLAGIDLCFHRFDEKAIMQSGSQIAYWQVEDLSETVKEFVAGGASVYRRSIEIPEGGRVAQIKDPFGNIIGVMEKT